MNTCILAFDIGTSAVKASLVSAELAVLAEAAQPYQTFFPAPQCVQQDAQSWWNSAVRAAQRLFDAHPGYKRKVCAIGVSGHMLGLLPVNVQGVPLAPAMIHADTRAISQAERIGEALGREFMYSLTGNVLSPAATLCKALWMKQNCAQIYGRTARFLQSKDYLNFMLCGNMDTTDFSDTSHAMLIDIRRRRYLTDVFSELGLDAGHFPAIHKSTDIIGKLTPPAARRLALPDGIPVVAGGGDGACANVGAGIVRSGDAYCSLGTTGWIACGMDEPYLDDKRRVFNILSLDGTRCGVFGTVQCVGRAIDWAQKVYVPEGIETMNSLAAQITPGSDGLVFLPYLEGERSPIFDPLARGVFFGIRPEHDRRHFARAVFEGVSYALTGIVDILRERMPLAEMRIIGGGAKSALWRQMLADMARVRIRDVRTPAAAATSLGAAAAAGTAVGLFDSMDDAARKLAVKGGVSPDPKNEEAYASGMRLYQSLYPLLRPAFHATFIGTGNDEHCDETTS